MSGWLLGHLLARGRPGFPGDPLAHGQLGSAANVGFWAALGAPRDDPDGDPARQVPEGWDTGGEPEDQDAGEEDADD